jgi:hypothetical protein
VKRLLVAASLAVLSGLLAVGCWLEVWNWHGEAIVRWRIEGRVDPAACAEHGVEQVEVRALDAHGQTSATITARCDVFLATAWLDPGWYTAELTPRGAQGAPLARPRRTSTFHVPYHGTGVGEVDFPRTAFSTPSITVR